MGEASGGAEVPAILNVEKGDDAESRASAERLAAELWGEGFELAHLSDGVTNDVYKAELGDRVYVIQVQLEAERSATLQIDRAIQLAATRHAEEIGIGPPVVHHAEEPPALVTEFVPGATFSGRKLDDATLRRAADCFAALHASTPSTPWPGVPTDTIAVDRGWIDGAKPHFPQLAEGLRDAEGLITRIEAVLPEMRQVPSHNDPMPGNLIDDGDRVWLIDWEFSYMNDPAHDLANFGRLNALTPDQEEVFLSAYGDLDEVELATVVAYRPLVQLWEASYVLMCGSVDFLEMDHAEFFTESFQSIGEVVAGERFSDAVRLLEAHKTERGG